MIPDESNQQARARSLATFGAQLGSIYIGDSSNFVPHWYLDTEQLAYSHTGVRTSEDLVVANPITVAKTLRTRPGRRNRLRLPRSHSPHLLHVLSQA